MWVRPPWLWLATYAVSSACDTDTLMCAAAAAAAAVEHCSGSASLTLTHTHTHLLEVRIQLQAALQHRSLQDQQAVLHGKVLCLGLERLAAQRVCRHDGSVGIDDAAAAAVRGAGGGASTGSRCCLWFVLLQPLLQCGCLPAQLSHKAFSASTLTLD